MKCDEERPKCRECVKRGTEASCVYGDNQIIFQSENAFVEQNYILKTDGARAGAGNSGKKRVADHGQGAGSSSNHRDVHRPPRAMQFVNESANVREGYVSEDRPSSAALNGRRPNVERRTSNDARLQPPTQQPKSDSPVSRSSGKSTTPVERPQAGTKGHRSSFQSTPRAEWPDPMQHQRRELKQIQEWQPQQPQTQTLLTGTPQQICLAAADSWQRITQGLFSSTGSHFCDNGDFDLTVYDENEHDTEGMLIRRKHLPSNEILPGKGFQSWSGGFNGRPLFTLQEIALNDFFTEWLPMDFALGDPIRWSAYMQNGLHTSAMLREAILALARVTCTQLNPVHRREHAFAALEHHGAAVSLLQVELYRPDRILSDEVLAATSLVGVYELALGASNERFGMHIDGTLRLIRLRGPKLGYGAPDSVVNRIISGCMAQTVRISLEHRQRTFFAEPAWIEAARGCQAFKFCKWGGTELLLLMLRLTNIVATGHYDLEAAVKLDQDIRAERARFLPSATYISNELLVQRSQRASQARLTQSPFGPESVCYDVAFSGSYYYTQAAIVFDYILLTLRSVYTTLSEGDLGESDHESVADLIRCAQYLTHDPVNQSVASLVEFWQPLIYAIHFARSMPELNWILHCFDITGIQSALRFGNVSRGFIHASCEAPCLTETEQRILKGFLLEKGIADVKEYVSEIEVIESMNMGFRRNLGSTADGAPCLIIDPEDSSRIEAAKKAVAAAAAAKQRQTTSHSPTSSSTNSLSLSATEASVAASTFTKVGTAQHPDQHTP